MNDFGLRAQTWLLHSLFASGLLLFVAAVMVLLVRQPSRRRQIGSWSIRAALFLPILTLLPSWLIVPLPAREPPPVVAAAPAVSMPQPAAARPTELVYALILPNSPAIQPATPAAEPPPVAATPAPHSRWPAIRFETIALVTYFSIATALLVRWLLGHVALRRLVARAQAPDERLAELFAREAEAANVRLRLVERLRVPVCCGLWRPTILLPAGLARTSDDKTLRWVFAHELAHLRRGDPWTCFWFGLAGALFFPLPWFWWLKRQVGLCQEYLADAAAAGLAARVEDYAEFLVSLSRTVSRPNHQLAAATGVLGNSSDLLRRITMLLKNERLEGRCPRRLSLLAAGGFLGLAVVLGGLGLSRQSIAAPLNPAPDENAKKDEPKKDAPKDEAKKADAQKPAKPGIQFDQAFPFQVIDPNDPDFQKTLQKMMEELNKQLQQGLPGAMALPLGPGGDFRRGLFHQGSGRLGARVAKPSDVLVEQLDLPKGQGMVIEDVKPDSAAAKAGLKANDILLELADKSVSSDVQEFRKQIGEIKANTPVAAVLLRKGKKETVKGLSLPEAKDENDLGGFGGRLNLQGLPNFPNMPQIPQIPQLPPRPLRPAIGLPGGGFGNGMTLQVTNGTFNVNKQENDQQTTVSGKIEDGKMVVTNVTIIDGNDRVTVDKLEAVPEKYRERVKDLLKNVHVK